MADAATHSITCPNCGAVNAPSTRICASCGVDMVRYTEVMPQIQELKGDYATEQQTRLAEDATTTLVDESERGRHILKVQLRSAFLIAAVCLVLAGVGAAWYAHQQQLRRQRLAHQYEKARVCLENEDYICALEHLDGLLRAEPDYPEAQGALAEARYKLAQHYVEAKQWRQAVTTLEVLLDDYPYHVRALSLLETTYNLWMEDAVREKDWVTVVRLRLMRGTYTR